MRRKVRIAAIALMAVVAGFGGWRLWPKEYIDGPREPLPWRGAQSVGPGIDILARYDGIEPDSLDGPVFGMGPIHDGMLQILLGPRPTLIIG